MVQRNLLYSTLLPWRWRGKVSSHEMLVPIYQTTVPHARNIIIFTFTRECKWLLITSNELFMIQINHQPDATIFQFINLTFIYSSTCFGRFPAHRQEFKDLVAVSAFYLRIVVTVVLCSWSGRLARPRTQHNCHHDMKVKPEAATAVIELLTMGRKIPQNMLSCKTSG